MSPTHSDLFCLRTEVEPIRLELALLAPFRKDAGHIPVTIQPCRWFSEIPLPYLEDLRLFLRLHQDQQQKLCPESVLLELLERLPYALPVIVPRYEELDEGKKPARCHS